MEDFSIRFSALSVFAPTSEITYLYLDDYEYNASYYYMNHIEDTQPITKYVRLNDFANYKDIIVSSSDEQVVKAETTERYSVARALHAVDRSDVVLMVLDARDGVTEQDQRIAGYAHEAWQGFGSGG